MNQRGDIRGWENASVNLELDQLLKGGSHIVGISNAK